MSDGRDTAPGSRRKEVTATKSHKQRGNNRESTAFTQKPLKGAKGRKLRNHNHRATEHKSELPLSSTVASSSIPTTSGFVFLGFRNYIYSIINIFLGKSDICVAIVCKEPENKP